MGVDIIIPIYNAYDDLRKCLQSVYQYTDLVENRLILINDNSSDTRIEPYLNSQTKENVIIIHNKENKGFSNNINLGMAQSKERDVLLLNSDTIVTKNWVEKIVECAYSDRAIGTVTPLSNNATLCSVPNFCEENSLPEGMNIDQAAAIVEECSLKKYPRITVANGFCMFIKREVIKTIGGFDADTFRKGYGEENDFCNRAEQMGYIHVMCDDTYIYHTGTKSFETKEKEMYIKEHEKILYKRYPLQMRKNEVYCRDNPNGWVCENVGMYFDIWNGKKNILYLLQSDFREGAEDNVGGTQLHVKHLTIGLRKSMNIFVVARDRDFLRVTAYTEYREYPFRFYIGEKELFPLLRNRDLAKIFRIILEGFKIDLVHVHHTVNTSLDIYYEAERLRIPVIFTVHDFFCVCPTIKLLDDNGKICVYKENNNCNQCVKKKLCIYKNDEYILSWRKKHEEVLGMCHKIVVPSKSAKGILVKYYQNYEDKIQIIEHGMDKQPVLNVDDKHIMNTDMFGWKLEEIDRKKRCPFIKGSVYVSDSKENYKIILKITDHMGKQIYFPTTYERNFDIENYKGEFFLYIPNNLFTMGDLEIELLLQQNNRLYTAKGRKEIIKDLRFETNAKLRVAFIGGLNEEKGGKIAYEIIKRGASNIEWYVLGNIGEENLYKLKQDNLIKVAAYDQEDLSTWLEYYNIEVVCILPKWPETFSYTLSEAVMSEIPVIVTDVGALGQRVRDYKYGEVVSLDEVIEKTIKKLNEYMENKEALQIAFGRKHKTMHEMLEDYRDIYNNIYESTNKGSNYIDIETNLHIFNARYQRMHSSDKNRESELKILELQRYISKIEGSAAFKIMRKAYSMKIPFKEQIRQFILKQK